MKFVVLALAAASGNAAVLRGTPEAGVDTIAEYGHLLPFALLETPGVGSVAKYGHLLPYHPDGMPESVMKTRCTNFVNHLLEKGAYSPAVVRDVMPKCAWSKKDCSALKKDLMKRLAKKDKSLVQVAGPAGPDPKFVTAGGLDDSVYGWCDVMYNMMKKKSIDEQVKSAAEIAAANAAAKKKQAEAEKAAKAKMAADKKAAAIVLKRAAEDKKKAAKAKKAAVKKAAAAIKKTAAKKSALQTGTAPDMAAEVAMESSQNLQIHDGFAQDEKKDEETEGQVKANKDMSALQTADEAGEADEEDNEAGEAEEEDNEADEAEEDAEAEDEDNDDEE